MLVEKLAGIDKVFLRTFVTYRGNRTFTEAVIERRPDLMSGLSSFVTPIKDDPDSQLLARLHALGLLDEETRANFAAAVIDAIADSADSSIFEESGLKSVLNTDELTIARQTAKNGSAR
jgi:hypothetical protein